MAKPMELGLVNSATVAAAFGVSERRVQQFASDGIIDFVKVGKTNRYDLLETVRKYVAYLKEEVTTDEVTSLEERKIKAEAECKEMKAAEARIHLAELEGTMHRSEDVRAATEQLVYTVRSMLVAMPGRLAVDVVGASGADEASRMICREVEHVLEELMGFRYDPEVYAAMMRERKGWGEVADDEDDAAES